MRKRPILQVQEHRWRYVAPIASYVLCIALVVSFVPCIVSVVPSKEEGEESGLEREWPDLREGWEERSSMDSVFSLEGWKSGGGVE
jgi:hypothetical protein